MAITNCISFTCNIKGCKTLIKTTVGTEIVKCYTCLTIYELCNGEYVKKGNLHSDKKHKKSYINEESYNPEDEELYEGELKGRLYKLDKIVLELNKRGLKISKNYLKRVFIEKLFKAPKKVTKSEYDVTDEWMKKFIKWFNKNKKRK